MHFLPEKLDDYIVSHSQEEPQLLKELTRETYQKILQPIMLSGPYQGRVLSMISKLVNPKSVLELGTFTGYSTLCIAEGLTKEGKIHTIDINEELEPIQSKYFEKSAYRNNIVQYVGNAIDIIPKIDHKFDLVFIDADKPNYVNYFDLIIEKLNHGGILLSDNVLWHGKVIEPLKDKDIATATLLQYNQILKDDDRIESVVLPIRDGLTLSRRLPY